MNDIPTVTPHRVTSTQWFIRCPHCGGEHVHGAGEGHRVAHCPSEYRPNPGYILAKP